MRHNLSNVYTRAQSLYELRSGQFWKVFGTYYTPFVVEISAALIKVTNSRGEGSQRAPVQPPSG